MSDASATPWQKPAQAAEMSNAAALLVPSSLGDERCDGGCLQHVGDRGHDDAVDLLRIDAGPLDRLARGADGHDWTVSCRLGPAALDDARAGLDPLVAGVDELEDLVVGDDPAGR